MTKKIFHADNDLRIRETIARAMRRLLPDVGFESFDGGQAVLRAIFDAEVPPDVVIIDRDLGDMLGEEVAGILHLAHFQGKVIMLTGNSSMEDAPHGVDQLLHKPISAGELKAALRHYLYPEPPAADQPVDR